MTDCWYGWELIPKDVGESVGLWSRAGRRDDVTAPDGHLLGRLVMTAQTEASEALQAALNDSRLGLVYVGPRYRYTGPALDPMGVPPGVHSTVHVTVADDPTA